MKVLLLGISLIFAVAAGLPHKRGTCLTMCGPLVHRSCPSGYECKSNGCGHECFKTTFVQPIGCPVLDCQLHCMLGLARDAQGCEICKCDYSHLAVLPGR